MDTSSHIMFGLGLGALAQIDPAVAGDSALTQAVLIGTVVGSNAPDFDYAFKLKGSASYRKNHRGWSHSLPALPLWAMMVSGPIYFFFQNVSFAHLFLWTLIAVFVHVLLDLLNVYGTQVFRPFTKKWIAMDSIPLVDPYIFIFHLAGFSLIPLFHPGRIFVTIYLLILLYILCWVYYVKSIQSFLSSHFKNAVRIKLMPKAEFLKWEIFIETEDDFLFGVYSRKAVLIEHTIPKIKNMPEIVQESATDESIANFLASTKYAYPFVKKKKNGFFIFWKDLRFRSKKFFPFLAVMFVSHDQKTKDSYVGRIHSLKHFKKILKELKSEKEKARSS